MNKKMFKIIKENKRLVVFHAWIIPLALFAIACIVAFITFSIIRGWE
jgi:hypothetical protein